MTAKEWLQKAKKEGFAIGALNVSNLETFKAIVTVAAEKKSPIIIESSPGETEWMGAENVVDIAKNYSEEFSIPIFVNLDHAETLDQCMEGIEAGYDLIHFDGSALPYEENLEIAKKVVSEAHKKNLLVEAEIDRMARKSSEVYKEQISMEELRQTFSKPEKVKEFVEATGVDTMATLFGNIHGVFPTQPPLDFDLIKKIREAVPNTFLSIHGGSGIPEGEVKKAIKIGGFVKVNINTEMRRAYRDTLEDVLEEKEGEYAMYKVLGPVLDAVEKVVAKKIDAFGSAGKV
ncbi:MAG TPA: class II fructose-bisphosphate aldolase [Candidatus Nanoarchaeia archaeon]